MFKATKCATTEGIRAFVGASDNFLCCMTRLGVGVVEHDEVEVSAGDLEGGFEHD